MSRKHYTPMPNLVAEAVLSTCKIFIIFMIVNNLFWWVGVRAKAQPTRVGDAHIEINQSGNGDIQQEIKQ